MCIRDSNKPPQEGIYQHFRTIANAVELPIILYNIPGRCVVNMEAETTLRLARDCANIVAVKEASGKMDQVRTIVNGAPAVSYTHLRFRPNWPQRPSRSTR